MIGRSRGTAYSSGGHAWGAPVLFVLSVLIGVAILLFCEYLGLEDYVDYVALPSRITEIGGEQYAVIPAGLSSSAISIQEGTRVRLNGVEYHDGDVIDYAQWDDRRVDLEIWRSWEPFHYKGSLHVYCLDSLPTMSLTMKDADLDEIKEERDNEAAVGYAVADAAGEADSMGTGEIKVHGNTTWKADKRSYQIEVEGGAASMLGMDEAAKWLLISNYVDASGLLNQFAYTLQQSLGVEDAPECRQVNLYINGEYQGMYLLVSKIDTGDVPMVELCGEYTWLEADADQQMLTWRRYMRLRNPAHATEEERTSIQQQIQIAEEALYDESSDAFTQYYDLNSWALQYLLQELMVNGDTELNSEYFRVIDGVLYAGPGWDYDRSLEALMSDFDIDTNSLHVQGLKEDTIPTDKNTYTRLWLPELYAHQAFRDALETYYQETFSPAVHRLLDQLPQMIATNEKSARMDARKWSGEDMYDYQTNRVMRWLPARAAFLDSYIGHEDEFTQEITVMDGGRYDSVYCVPKE